MIRASNLATGLLVASLLICVSLAQEEPAPSCTSEGCHAELIAPGNVHSPVEDDCENCHAAEGDHEFAAIENTNDVCTMCHDQAEGENLHMPVEDDCTTCHSAHSSENSSLLLAGQTELCFACHDEDILAGEVKHGPSGAGQCSLCHDPHSSPQDKFLKAAEVEVCGECHTVMAEDMGSAGSVHMPAEDSCASCHNPHSGSNPRMLAGTTTEVCAECHDDVVTAATEAAYKHAPLQSEASCTSCHSPHMSSQAALLEMGETELCLSCHDKPLPADAPKVQNIKALLDSNPNHHGPVADGDCGGCHQVHGSANFALLTEPYPARFYAGFDLENYQLCFTCHESTMVTEQYTLTLTGFRDGDVNMHYLHVNKATRGRTCRACHEVHASTEPKHLARTVLYGSWEMPIEFEQTETGGTCAPGCHAKLSYDREKELEIGGE